MFERKVYKEKAKKIYKQFFVKAFMAGLVLSFLSTPQIMNVVQVTIEEDINVSEGGELILVNPAIQRIFFSLWWLIVIMFILYILLMPTETIVEKYLKGLLSGDEKPQIVQYFKIRIFLRITVVQLLYVIAVIIGCLAFIFPGIYLTYKWRYASIVALEHPELSIGEVFAQSSSISKGYKFDLWILDLSFIGWYILIGFIGAITFYVVAVIMMLVLIPYISLSDMEAYRQLDKKVNSEALEV
ncbi:MAG: DUF975 family protein [Breznakia sp.]